MSSAHAVAEGVTERAAQVLRLLSGALGAGVVVFAFVVAFFYTRSGGEPMAPNAARLINILTMGAMAWTVAGIALGEFLWRRGVRAIAEPARADAGVQAAFLIRLAVREGTALLGLCVLLLGAMNGVLAAFPAYWVNAAPAVLFLFFIWARWPTLDGLRSQVRDVFSPV